MAVLNDLHKGRDTGPAWSLLIDLSAAALCFYFDYGVDSDLFPQASAQSGPCCGISGHACGSCRVLAMGALNDRKGEGEK